MRKFSLHLTRDFGTRDYGTMTCDNDNDYFIQRYIIYFFLKMVIVIVNGHGQKVPCPVSKQYAIYSEQLLDYK